MLEKGEYKMAKFTNIEFFEKDGNMYVSYDKEGLKGISHHEQPYYDEKGEISPEVAVILDKAQKTAEEESKPSETTETENGVINTYSVVPYDGKVDKESFFSKNKHLIAGLLIGGVITAGIFGICNSCSKEDNSSRDLALLDDNLEQNDEEVLETVKYITMDEYQNGVKDLCKYLNDDLHFDYLPTDVTSFYYYANMDNIDTDLFNQLVSEGYIQDNEMDIVSSTFKITSALRTKAIKDSKIDFDFSKIFVDSKSIENSINWSKKYNYMLGNYVQFPYFDSFKDLDELEIIDLDVEYDKLNKTEQEQLDSNISTTFERASEVMDEVESYTVVEPYEYYALPIGGRDICNWVVLESICIKAGEIGVSHSEAFETEMNDLTRGISNIRANFEDCVLEEEKVLTK